MNSFCLRQYSLASCAVAALVVLAGCGRNNVQVYRVAKDQPAGATDAQAGALPAGHPAMGGSQTPNLKWTLPSGWEEVTPGEMRLAEFRVKGDGGKQADVGIFPFPGMAGGDLANVNRWRGQVGLSPISQEELTKEAEPVEIAGQKAGLFDMAGENAGSGDKTRILAAMMNRDNVAWFFKMTGDDELVEKEKPAFVSFLKSLSFVAAPAEAQLPPSHPPIDSTMMAAQELAGGGSEQPKPQWQVPAGWQEMPGNQFLVAKFLLKGADNAEAAVNVSSAGGAGGGVEMNVNRWRGQLGLAPLGDADLQKAITPVDMAGAKAMFVDMTGTDPRTGQPARLVAAIVPQGNQTWFYKLMGNEQLVAQQKDAFTTFVKTAQYPK